mmetsp:Transcript_55466/g.76271  ORF Transcript_55466/g.76271 Transcript_55466/m.76271 type:complete len:216 (+) Transcript_55466:906-1553(+)
MWIKCLRHLQIIQITANLAVDLLEDIGSFRQVKLESIASSHNLGWHAVVFQHFLVHGVEALITKNTKHNCRMLEVVLTHVVLKLSFQALSVLLIIKLNPIWLFNFHPKLSTSFCDIVVNVISLIVPSISIDHDPFLFKKRCTSVNWQSAKSRLIARQSLIVHTNDLRSSQDGTLNTDRGVFNLQVPIFHRFLILQLITHVLDFLHLLTWSASSMG